jgi:transcriptional regulator with XRE-family HTH domain
MTERTPPIRERLPPDRENPSAGYYGKQLRKARMGRGWTIDELARRSSISPAHISNIEGGHRAPTEKSATAVDRAFGGHAFWDLYHEVKTWMPPGFRDWQEHEDKTTTLRDYSPTVLTGLLQTERYARTILESFGATEDVVRTRLANRLERQRHLFGREVRAWFLVDEASLYRLAGTPEVMTEALDRVLEVARLPLVTVQVLPPVIHPATASGFVLTDTAAYCEHVTGGFVYTEAMIRTKLDVLFDTLRGECMRVSESQAVIREARETWSGGRVPTAARTAETA